MPARVCLEPRCPNLATYRGRCPTHAKVNEQGTHPNKRFYNSKRWQTTRRKQLALHPLCQEAGCDQLATDVDHILPIEQGGEKWSFSNLQSLCHRHHGMKTRREQQQRPDQGGTYA